MNIFETSLRFGYEYPSTVGNLSTSQLFALPLIARDERPCLNDVAKRIDVAIKAEGAESFVSVRSTDEAINATKMDVVKRVIEIRQEEIAARLKEKENTETLRKLLVIKANRNEEGLNKLSDDDLDAQIKALNG